MRMTTKGPRTYRKLFPGEHVMAILIVYPTDTEIMIERPVSKEIADQILKILMDDIKKNPLLSDDQKNLATTNSNS